MCGLTGICSPVNSEAIGAAVRKAGHAIEHRGPDGEGIYCDPRCGLMHKRLAIIDLASGQQPLYNEDGTLVIVFNGEIYNYAELREYLLKKGHVLKTGSDTETIVHLFEEGVEALTMLRGMFAFAIWDTKKRELFAMRDRIGIKPLYYTLTGEGTLLFASEIKAIVASGMVRAEPDVTAMREYLAFKFPIGRRTFFKGIQSLEPGHYLHWKDGRLTTGRYWKAEYTPERLHPQLAEEFREILEETVKYHLVSDVPVGAFLSGGLDTSAIVSVASGSLDGKLRTYTCGTADERMGDLHYSRIVAQRCGSDHHEVLHTPEEFSSFMKRCIWHLDEPGGGSTAIHGYYVAKRAVQDVKVLLSGEGADEVLGGYYHHWLPHYRTLSFVQRGLNYRKWRQWGGIADRAPGEFLAPGKESALQVYLTRHVSPLFSRPEFYTTDFFREVRDFDPAASVEPLLEGYRHLPVTSQVMHLDLGTYLYRILHIYDRMCMAVGLENRVPFLDHRFVEFCCSVPPARLLEGMQTKALLRNYLSERVGRDIAYRPKTGFTLPVDAWFRGAMSGEVTRILDAFKGRGIFEPRLVDAVWDEFRAGGGDREDVWRLISLEYWFQCYVD